MPQLIQCCKCLYDSVQYSDSLRVLYGRLRLQFPTDGDVFHQIMEHTSSPEPQPVPGAPPVEMDTVETLQGGIDNGFCDICNTPRVPCVTGAKGRCSRCALLAIDEELKYDTSENLYRFKKPESPPPKKNPKKRAAAPSTNQSKPAKVKKAAPKKAAASETPGDRSSSTTPKPIVKAKAKGKGKEKEKRPDTPRPRPSSPEIKCPPAVDKMFPLRPGLRADNRGEPDPTRAKASMSNPISSAPLTMTFSTLQRSPFFGGGLFGTSISPLQTGMFGLANSSNQLQSSTSNIAPDMSNTSPLEAGNTTNTTFGQFKTESDSATVVPSVEAPSFTDIDAIGSLLPLPTLDGFFGNRMSLDSAAQTNTLGNFGGSSVFNTTSTATGTSLPPTSYFSSSEVSDASAASTSTASTSSQIMETSQLNNNGFDHGDFANNMFQTSSIGNLLWPDQSGIPASYLINNRDVSSGTSGDSSTTSFQTNLPDNQSPATSDRSFNSMSLFESALPPPSSPSELFGAWATAAVLLNNGLGEVERSSGRIRCTRPGCHNLSDSWAELRNHHIGAHTSKSGE